MRTRVSSFLLSLFLDEHEQKAFLQKNKGKNFAIQNIGGISNVTVVSKDFDTFGTTGFKPEDYKKYKNKELYEDAKKASENYNPEIVYFSEFDVVKVLEKVENKNDGIEI